VALARRHGDGAIVMGCTEVPLGLQGSAAIHGLKRVDPARVPTRAWTNRACAGSSPHGTPGFVGIA
jgi:aspartate racemase